MLKRHHRNRFDDVPFLCTFLVDLYAVCFIIFTPLLGDAHLLRISLL